VDCLDPEGNTPLHLAARQNQMAVVKALMSVGCSTNIPNKQGKKAIDLAKDPALKSFIAGKFDRLEMSNSDIGRTNAFFWWQEYPASKLHIDATCA
jgi:ankyrin repeat protein